MIESRILIGTVNHKGKAVETYVPQIRVLNGDWVNVLSDKSYILKNSFDPVRVCERCYGKGCNNCRDGFRKGESVDLKQVAESYLNIAIEDVRKVLKYINRE